MVRGRYKRSYFVKGFEMVYQEEANAPEPILGYLDLWGCIDDEETKRKIDRVVPQSSTFDI